MERAALILGFSILLATVIVVMFWPQPYKQCVEYMLEDGVEMRFAASACARSSD